MQIEIELYERLKSDVRQIEERLSQLSAEPDFPDVGFQFASAESTEALRKAKKYFRDEVLKLALKGMRQKLSQAARLLNQAITEVALDAEVAE